MERAHYGKINALLASTNLGPVPTVTPTMCDANPDLLDDIESLTKQEPELEQGLEPKQENVPSFDLEVPYPEPSQLGAVAASGELKYIPIEYLGRGAFQPRRDFDPAALEELAQSIRQQGLMQPIVVRAVAKNKYEIIAGERRWRACQLSGLDTLPCLVKSVDDESALAMALIENMQREDLNPMEEALGLHRLHTEFDLTHQQVAELVGKSRSAVTNLLRLINLQSDVKTLLERGDLDMGHARALLSLPASVQLQAAKTAVARGLSVRHMETYVRNLMNASDKKPAIASKDPNTRDLETRLSERLGAKINIQHTAQGKGSLVIKYTSLAELDGIIEHILDMPVS
ncbi:MAG: ParB/RepB/Spo0J family partition protein [Gammaproteobacteria bacterium]